MYHEQNLPIPAVTTDSPLAGEEDSTPARRSSGWKSTAEVAFVALLLLFALIRPFFLEPFYIPSESMHPTLETGDRLLVNKLSYRMGNPERGEVVVFYGSEQSGHPDEIYVKRIVALPGEQVAVREGKTFVQGMPMDEDYLNGLPYGSYGPYTVPKDTYFVMGDNRNDSRDSRFWGSIPRGNLIGHAVIVFWPPNRLHEVQ